MAWKDLSSWLKGGIIGGIIGFIFTGLFLLCSAVLTGESGMICWMPLFWLLYKSGILLIIKHIPILVKSELILHLLSPIILSLLIGLFIGVLFEKISLQKKIGLVFIAILILVPLPIYNDYLIHKDEQIIKENMIMTEWIISDYGPCYELSDLSANRKEECLNSILVPKDKKEASDEFSRRQDMQECMKKKYKPYCISEIAFQLKDYDICQFQLYGPLKESCISEIAIANKDASSCPTPKKYQYRKDYPIYSDSTYNYNHCIAAIAEETGDIELCENINKNSTQYGDCRLKIIKKEINLDACYELDNYVINNPVYGTSYWGYRDDCINNVAINSNNASMCELPERPRKKDDCYYEIASKLKNVELCYNIVDESITNNCIFQVALKTGNKELCNRLEDPAKSNCINRFSA